MSNGSHCSNYSEREKQDRITKRKNRGEQKLKIWRVTDNIMESVTQWPRNDKTKSGEQFQNGNVSINFPSTDYLKCAIIFFVSFCCRILRYL
jgi:hypothetical protein